MGRRWRRRNQLLETGGSEKLQEELLDRNLWSARFGRGPVLGQATEWMNWIHSAPSCKFLGSTKQLSATALWVRYWRHGVHFTVQWLKKYATAEMSLACYTITAQCAPFSFPCTSYWRPFGNVHLPANAQWECSCISQWNLYNEFRLDLVLRICKLLKIRFDHYRSITKCNWNW